MAIKKISEFVSAVPTSADKILFEQNEKGKSCSIGDAVNTCSLTLEEIQETADLTGKVASAEALKRVSRRYTATVDAHSETTIDIRDLELNREYLVLYTTDNGALVSGGALLSKTEINSSVIHLNEKSLSSFTLSLLNENTLKFANGEDYPFTFSVTILG